METGILDIKIFRVCITFKLRSYRQVIYISTSVPFALKSPWDGRVNEGCRINEERAR